MQHFQGIPLLKLEKQTKKGPLLTGTAKRTSDGYGSNEVTQRRTCSSSRFFTQPRCYRPRDVRKDCIKDEIDCGNGKNRCVPGAHHGNPPTDAKPRNVALSIDAT